MGSDVAHRPILSTYPQKYGACKADMLCGQRAEQGTTGAQKKRPLGTPHPFFPLLKRLPPRHTQKGRGNSGELAPRSCLPDRQGGEERGGQQVSAGSTAAGRGAYVTDLVLGLLDSLEFRCICHHTEAFALVLLKLLLVAHLEDQGGERDSSEGRGSREGPSLWPPLRRQPARREIPTRNPPAATSITHPQTQSRSLSQEVLGR